jgi:predicted transcriptional regulator YheO
MKRTISEQSVLLRELQHVAQGLAETFAPFCEIVVHDLRRPKHAIYAIHNNLSGRSVGDPATELGLARIADPNYPQVIANYANQFADGRQAKSTSIGIRDSTGQYVAALCLNIDLTLFRSFQNTLAQFLSLDASGSRKESLNPAGGDAIRAKIDEFAARRASTPRTLKAEERRSLLRELKESGCLEVRRSMELVAAHLGVSRATIYVDAK